MKRSTPHAAASFDGQRIAWGIANETSVYREGDRLYARMGERDLEPTRHELRYFFGRGSLEQHLVELPGGRLQALPLGFDVRRGDWFDIFPGDERRPGDYGHWLGRGMNANSRCLYCHTTGFVKGYDSDSDGYRTRWAEMGVGCEACHGAGRRHVDARRVSAGNGDDDYAPVAEAAMMDLCATCHSRRRELLAGFRPGDVFLDFFEPELLDVDAYFPDGQVRDENFEWLSFMQTRMHAKRVTCLDCHEVHSGRLKRRGNDLCLECHEPRLAKRDHTHHETGSAGSACVACHMPVTVYMARDERRDHSMVFPDPGAEVELGITSPCSRCHAERGAEWARGQVASWYAGSTRLARRRELARAFGRARRRDPASVGPMMDCLVACDDVVRRASAALVLEPFTERVEVIEALSFTLETGEPLERTAAARALGERGVRSRAVLELLLGALTDPVRSVRLQAAWGLRAVDLDSLDEADGDKVRTGFDEWLRSMEHEADQPETHHTLGVFYDARAMADRALASYRRAIRLEPQATAPRYNLAVLLVRLGRIDKAEEEFVELLNGDPDFAPAHYGLGLLYGEKGLWAEASASLSKCLRIEPAYPGALRNLARAYLKAGVTNLAKMTLQNALAYPPARGEALSTLVSIHLELGDRDVASEWARRAVAEDPGLADDPRITELLADAPR